jgi:hypothetical protein
MIQPVPDHSEPLKKSIPLASKRYPFNFPIDQYIFESTVRILLDIKDLSFQIGALEPIWGTFAIFDLKKKEKVTENFNFDLNSHSTLETLGPHKVLFALFKGLNKITF